MTSSPPFFPTEITAPGPTKLSSGSSSIDFPPGTMCTGASTCVPAWHGIDISVTFSGWPLARSKNFFTRTSESAGIFGMPS